MLFINALLHCMEQQIIQIEIAYATAKQQQIIALEVNAGTTAGQAIAQTSLPGTFPEIELSINKVGIFGQVVNLNTRLQSGDRVEIYRPLVIDPRLARQERVRKLKR